MKYTLFSWLIALLILTACQKDDAVFEDHFYLVNDGSSMPVYVRGNIDADAILLFLHGGPGGNASQATFIPSFQEIEEEYAMAYWDQRASGLSLGNPDESTFTVEQFVEDLDYVIQALQERYANKKIFILGHSWGGALGAAYLSTLNYQANVQGFVCMNSGHNLLEGLPLSVDWVENYATEQIDLGKRENYWRKVASWCAMEPDMTEPDNYFEYVEYLSETDAYRHDNQSVKVDPVTLNDILNSRLSLAILVGGRYLSREFNILELNLSDDMESISVPSLVLWGRHDGVNTIEMAYDAFESLGTDSSKKELVILEESAHEGYLEEPDLFVETVLTFIEKNK